MKLNQHDWLFIAGKAGHGKTVWIREHLKKIPKEKNYVLDYNVNDYQDLEKYCQIWDVEIGTPEEVEQFLRLTYEKGNCFVTLEEADNYISEPNHFIKRFVNTARNRGIGCMVNCKRPKSIPPVFRNRFTKLIIFKTDLPEDLDYLASWAGLESKNSIIHQQAPNLKVGEHLIVDMFSHEVTKETPIKITKA